MFNFYRRRPLAPSWRLIPYGFIFGCLFFSYNTLYSTHNLHVKRQPLTTIPHKIWQNSLFPGASQLRDTPSWLAMHPDFEYRLVSNAGAVKFCKRYLPHDENLIHVMQALKHRGLRSDLLRYIILAVEGGIYSDLDTIALRPFNDWIPTIYKKDAKVIIGLEFDRLGGLNWPEVHPDMQFCQWTIAAAPGHQLFHKMVNRALVTLSSFVQDNSSGYSNLVVSSAEFMRITGPSAWTDVVFSTLQEYMPGISAKSFSGMSKPTLIGDILLLPIDGFGMGQDHSNSTNDGSIPQNALVMHKFTGSWRLD